MVISRKSYTASSSLILLVLDYFVINFIGNTGNGGIIKRGMINHEVKHGIGPVAENGNHWKDERRCHCTRGWVKEENDR